MNKNKGIRFACRMTFILFFSFPMCIFSDAVAGKESHPGLPAAEGTNVEGTVTCDGKASEVWKSPMDMK